MAGRWGIRLLGGFELHHGTHLRSLPSPAERVVALLAIEGTHMAREQLATLLWPDASHEHASARLRTTLWRLRRETADLVARTRDALRLAGDVVVDVHDVTALGRRLDRQVQSRAATGRDPAALSPAELEFIEVDLELELVLDRLRAELLPGWYDDWVLLERERLRQLQLHTLEQLADDLSARERHGQAVVAGLAAVQLAPLRESAQRALVRAHLAEGNVGEALRQFERFRRLLSDQLNLAPTPAMMSLVTPFLRTSRRPSPP